MGGGKSKLRKNLKKKEIKRFVEETHFNHDEIVALYEHFKDIAASQDNDGVIDQHVRIPMLMIVCVRACVRVWVFVVGWVGA